MTGPEAEHEAAGEDAYSDELELAFMPGVFPCTEVGNAERLVAQWRESIRYCVERKQWLIWSGRQWDWDKGGIGIARKAKATVRALAKEAYATPNAEKRSDLLKWAMSSEKSSALNAMIAVARAELGVSVSLSECDADPWLLNCRNGTLNLRTRVLQKHNPADLITRNTGIDYDPAASSVLWLRVLENSCAGDRELAAYLQRVSGYSLAGVATEKKFFFLCGPPDAGKSTLINGLHACLGGYAKSTDFETWLERPQVGSNRNDLVALQGARLVTSVEVKKKAKWDTAQLKRFTGGDTITAMAKYEDEVSFVPACTIIMAANDAPKARDDDSGLWRRMQRVPFTKPIPAGEQIRNLAEVLKRPENACAILAWAVEGFAEWERIGIGSCRAVEDSTDSYKAENDWLGGFLDLYELDPASVIPAPLFRQQYEAYCKQEGQFTESTKELASQVEARLTGVQLVKIRGARMWRGLRLRPTDPQEGGWSDETPATPPPSPTEPPPPQQAFGFTPDPEEEEMPW